MLKRFVCLTVGCVVILAVAGIAYGAAVKIKSFDLELDEYGVPLEPNPDADGMAILNYASGQDKTIVQIIISDFEPDRTGGNAYTVEFVSPSHGFTWKYDIETDHHGHGTLHLTFSGDWSDSNLNIYVDHGAADEELRATGTNPGP